jgi:hypothetical protein
MRGLGRKLVAIQTEARCPKSYTWSTPPSRDDCSRPSSRHVAAGREHDSKQCRTPSSFCREPSRCALAFRLGRLRRRHYQRGRQQDFVPGMRVPRSGLPRVFDSALAYISMQTPGGRCICTSSCLTRAKHSWRTCRSLPPSQTHARQPPPGLYTPRPCAIKINPRTRIAAAKGQHSTERVSTAHSHTWTTGAPAGCGSTVARARRGERRVAGMPRSARGVGPVPSVVQDQSASPRRRPLRRRPLAVRGGLPGE